MRSRAMSIFVGGLLMLTACGTDEGGDTTTTEAMATTTEAGAESSTTSAESMDGVHASETDLGSILVDPDGFTLYIFTNDSGGESTCYDSCAELWPPVPADTPIGSDLDGSIFGSVARDDGSEQLTVNGMPLYLYTPDESPGDVTGQGFNGVWFVVDADGNVIEAAASDSTDEPEEDDRYDY